jgi:hypothetical protein
MNDKKDPLTLRDGMSTEELSVAIHGMMQKFRPQVAEIARKALRWDFCMRNDFPTETTLPSYAMKWRARIMTGSTSKVIVSTHFGATCDEAVDKAMEAEALLVRE